MRNLYTCITTEKSTLCKFYLCASLHLNPTCTLLHSFSWYRKKLILSFGIISICIFDFLLQVYNRSKFHFDEWVSMLNLFFRGVQLFVQLYKLEPQYRKNK